MKEESFVYILLGIFLVIGILWLSQPSSSDDGIRPYDGNSGLVDPYGY